jgi:hypothetical protein
MEKVDCTGSSPHLGREDDGATKDQFKRHDDNGHDTFTVYN